MIITLTIAELQSFTTKQNRRMFYALVLGDVVDVVVEKGFTDQTIHFKLDPPLLEATFLANFPAAILVTSITEASSSGTPGPEGPQGLPGLYGLDGEDGLDSFIPGPIGSTGPQGPQGIPGSGSGGMPSSSLPFVVEAEEPGDTFTLPGPQGDRGPQGSAGSAGSPGARGLDGVPGLDGLDGQDGLDSLIPGSQGPRGIQGIQGPAGSNGTPGPPGPPGLDAEEAELPYIIPGPKGDTGPAGGGGGGGTTGTTTLNFGAFPGAPEAKVAVTGQATIASGSIIEAWLYPLATADHSADEHIQEEIDVLAHTIVVGTGFTITGRMRRRPSPDNISGVTLGLSQSENAARWLYGQYTVAWRWS